MGAAETPKEECITSALIEETTGVTIEERRAARHSKSPRRLGAFGDVVVGPPVRGLGRGREPLGVLGPEAGG